MQSSHISPASESTAINSFIGLNAYSEADAEFFYGRDEEIDQLYRLIRTHTLTSVFGKSGTGKTSLLNAGVFPKLREDNCLPFRIRLDFSLNSPALRKQVWQVLFQQIEQYGFTLQSKNTQQTLWEFFHKEDLWKIVTPVLLFDQFEEIFTLVKKQSDREDEIEHLITELADLIENTIPEKLRQGLINKKEQINFNYKTQRSKIIFAFREDFLPEMESITSKIPSVKNSRFRLTAMNGEQAYEVITKTWKEKISSHEARELIYYLTQEKQVDGTNNSNALSYLEIEPSLLSQVCTHLDKERIREQQDRITPAFLDRYPKNVILASIYHQALEESVHGMELASNDPNPVQVFIEEKLINEAGYRTKYTSNDIAASIKPGIDNLQQKYFIREEGPAVELTHDVIATLAKEDRDKRLKAKAQQEANVRAKKRALKYLAAAAILGLLFLTAFGIKSAYYERKADTAKNVVDSVSKESKVLEEKIKEGKARLSNINDSINNLRNNTGAYKGDTTVFMQLLLDSIQNLQAALYNTRQLVVLQQSKADSSEYYANLLKQRDASIDYYNGQMKDYARLRAKWKDAREYNLMFLTHLDSIISFRNDTANLQYRIGVINTNLEGYKGVLEH